VANYSKKWLDRKLSVFNKLNGRCSYCGEIITIDNFQIDHVIPRSLNGSDRLDNLMPACCSCNNYKGANTIDGFRYNIEKQIERLRRDKPTFKMAERFGLIHCTPKKIVFYFESL
jgi:5-methylcytosine-specific restriction endonuclease McrA